MGYISIFSPNAGKCGKNADQNNSEYGHILCSDDTFYKTKEFESTTTAAKYHSRKLLLRDSLFGKTTFNRQ